MRKNRRKICLQCQLEFTCPYGIGIGVWRKRRFCSKNCVSKFCKNGFKKGSPGWMLGRKITEKERQRLRTINLGRKFSKKTIEKMRISRVSYLEKHPELKQQISEKLKGREFSQETRTKLSLANRGEKNYNWKGGITPLRSKIWQSKDYAIWRVAVFMRDNHTCVNCGTKGGKLNADHIKPFALYPELRFAIDNGRTLCVECHRKTDTYGGRSIYRSERRVSP